MHTRLSTRVLTFESTHVRVCACMRVCMCVRVWARVWVPVRSCVRLWCACVFVCERVHVHDHACSWVCTCEFVPVMASMCLWV